MDVARGNHMSRYPRVHHRSRTMELVRSTHFSGQRRHKHSRHLNFRLPTFCPSTEYRNYLPPPRYPNSPHRIPRRDINNLHSPPPTRPTDKKTVSLGTQPLRLFSLVTPSRTLVFAASDRPTLLHMPSVPATGTSKLVLSALSLRDVLFLTPLSHPAYPDSLVIATKEGFRIGKMDQMSRLQVRSVGMPNGELPRRIARLDRPGGGDTGVGVVGVISLRISYDLDGSERTDGYLRVWDEETWQCTPPSPHPTPLLPGWRLIRVGIDVVKMPPNDLPQAISACELMNVSTDEKGWYFIVGSAVEVSMEDEPKEGLIRVFRNH